MGACASKSQALASEASNRASRAWAGGSPLGGGGDAMTNPGDGGSPKAAAKKKKKGRGRFTETREYELGLPEDASERERGCYLVFDTASGGALMTQWSETAVDGAWAFFFPRKNVAAFKFTTAGGKSELIRGLAVNKKKLFIGWTQYVKLANDNDAIMMIPSGGDTTTDFWFLDQQRQGVAELKRDEWFESRTASAIAMLPMYNQALKGVQRINPDGFVDIVTREGGVTWQPNR